MAVIMPAGKTPFDWSPKVEKEEMVKHASTKKQAAKEQSQSVSDKEALFEIAKRVLAEREESYVETDAMSEDFEEDGETSETSTAAEALEKAEEAIEQAEEAIEVAIEEVCPVAAEEEIEIPLDEEDGIVEIEIEESEIPGETTVEDDTIVEGRQECVADEDNSDEEDAEDEVSIEASTEDDFVRLSKISPANRKKLYSYWTQDLGYPPDYCKLLVKDYEK